MDTRSDTRRYIQIAFFYTYSYLKNDRGEETHTVVLCASRSFLRFDMPACSEAKSLEVAAVAAGVWTMLSDQILDVRVVVAIILYMQHTIHLINLINLYISKAAQTSETENV